MKRFIIVLTLLLLPTLTLAAGETSVLVYKGKHKMIGHEFELDTSQGTPFKAQDETWLVFALNDVTWEITNATMLSWWTNADGSPGGDSMPVYNLQLVVDELSGKPVGTLFSMDLNNDGGITPNATPSAKDVIVVQGGMKVSFTGVNSSLVPTSLKGYGIGLWDWTGGGTHNDIAAGPLALKLDRNYTLAANAEALGVNGVVDRIRADLAAKRGVDFPPAGNTERQQ